MERLQSAMILKTPMYHAQDAEIIEHPHTALYDAIKVGDTQRVEDIFYEGVDIDYHNFTSYTPLQYAILHNQYHVLALLLELGANTNIANHQGDTPLHLAIKLKQSESIHLLLRYHADKQAINANGENAYDLANSKIVKEMLDETLPIEIKNFDIFQHTMDNNLLALSLYAHKSPQLLFKKNLQGKTLLHVAYKRKRILAYLLNKGLDIEAVDKHQQTALTLSSMSDETHQSLLYLLKRGATIDHKTGSNASALLLSIKYGAIHNANALLEAGANIHLFFHTHTALTLTHHAISTFEDKQDAFRELETKLLIKGAHVDVSTNKLGWTPLIQTAIKPYDVAVKSHLRLLIELGADINYKDTNGRSALMLCASMGRYESCYKLIDNYANVNLVDNFGYTALMLATYYNHEDIVNLLLEHGSDVNITNDKGHNALAIAKEHKNENLIAILRDFGAIENDR